MKLSVCQIQRIVENILSHYIYIVVPIQVSNYKLNKLPYLNFFWYVMVFLEIRNIPIIQVVVMVG